MMSHSSYLKRFQPAELTSTRIRSRIAVNGERTMMARTEYGGDDPLPPSTVMGLGPSQGRKLENHEKKRLGLVTGQEEDPLAAPKPAFMYGVDPDYPELDENYFPIKN